jgi:beta-lactamase class A
MQAGTGKVRSGTARRQRGRLTSRGPAAALVRLLCAAAVAGCAPGAAPPLPAPVPVPAPAVRPAPAFSSDLAPLERAVRERIAAESGDFGIAVVDLETGRTLGINDRLVMHAASTMKVPVLIELYRRAAAGELDLEAGMVVHNRFRSIADGSAYSLSPADDSERALYDLVGQRVSFRDLARRMIVRSSNLATNILIDTLGAGRIQATMDRIGGGDMRVLRGVEDGPAFRAGLNNTTTARAFADVLASIARCDVMARAYCDELLEILAAQEFREMIPAGLPAGVRAAHKTGWIAGIRHDGGIVLPANSPPFALVVLTRGAPDSVAYRVAQDVARLTWEALGPDGALRPRWGPSAAELLALYDRVRVPAFPAPRLAHGELWSTLAPIIDAAPALHREVIAQSLDDRPIQLVRFGGGPVRVLLWSQMHGDETTASRALVDLFNYAASLPDDPRVRMWAAELTVLAVPMLNPDGAEAHRRRGSHGVDINRDARLLATPEGRALKALQERYRPDFGFNLHDQNPRSRTGSTGRLAAMSLLAPPPDADATPTPAFVRARQLTAHIAREVSPLVGAHLTRYDDSYNARAFGDGMQSWGVSTVLIETGSWGRDETKHFLRKANFVALASALDAIARGAWADVDVDLYATLPQNGRAVSDLVIRGGMVVLPGRPPYRADIAIDGAAVGGPAITQITDVGDLQETAARDTLDATGLFIHVRAAADGAGSESERAGTAAAAGGESDRAPAAAGALRPGGLQPGDWPELELRVTAEPTSGLVWTVSGTRLRQYVRASGRQPVEAREPPDAVLPAQRQPVRH